eukprot:g1408.t1
MTMMSAILSEKYILDDLCDYVPGAYWDKNYTRRDSIVKGQWMNCTDSEQFDRYYPDTPKTVNEVMLEQEMNAYVANELKYDVANFQMGELFVLLLTSQVLLRVCRLTVNDILSLRVSGWELALSVATLVRVAAVMVLGGLNLEMFTMSDYRSVRIGLLVLINSAGVVIDGKGLVGLPGLVDCHTHTVWAGSRADEFARRLAGEKYADIAKAGGGILSTVENTRKASLEELVRNAKSRVHNMVRKGVTTVEIKSGYGLSPEAEAKMLRAAKQCNDTARVVTTFLGAHALPKEFRDNRKGYVSV